MFDTLRQTALAPAPRVGFGPFGLADLWAMLRLWAALRRERRMLGSLDARLLRDIGLDPASAELEAARPFWDAPAGR